MAKKRRKKNSARRAAPKAARRRRRSYVTNPAAAPKRRRRRSYRRNPGILGNAGEVIKMGAGAIAGGIVIPRLVQLAPVESSTIKNIVGVAGSAALAYFGRKNPMLLGAGLGGAAICARNLVTNQFPMLAGDDLTQDESAALAYEMAGEDDEMSAPLMGAPLMGAPLMGDLNTPTL